MNYTKEKLKAFSIADLKAIYDFRDTHLISNEDREMVRKEIEKRLYVIFKPSKP